MMAFQGRAEHWAMKSYDAVIVGGGPAGLSCAIRLKQKGISACVIEKARYPRDKLCGGLVTEKTYRELLDLCPGDPFPFESCFIEKANRVSLWDRDQKKCETDVRHTLRIVDRKIFDARLMAYYRSIGGTVFEQEAVTGIDEAAKQIYSRRSAFHYGLLIAADGARSVIRNRLGLSLPDIGFCLEACIPRKDLPPYPGVQIRFNVIDNGYAWVFPCGEYWKAGFGSRYEPAFDYRKAFLAYLALLGVQRPEKYPLKGAFVPYGGYLPKAVVHDDVVFVGDAAGMVDPVYGEGLYFALRAGRALSNAVEKENGKVRLRAGEFEKERHKDLKYIISGRRLKRVFFRPAVQRLFLNRGCGHTGFIRYYIDSQVSMYACGHNEIGKLLWRYKKKQEKI